MIIAIDGPAGAGKSTVAKLLARELGFLYIDTGAMYRALTLKVVQERAEIKDTGLITRIAKDARIELRNNADNSLQVFLDGKDVTREIRQPLITKFVSDVAKIREVREVMLRLQRQLGSQAEAVMDGRDIGTVVFPDAKRKFYLDAEFKERVRRRYEELKGTGEDVTLAGVEADLRNRDMIDSTREFAPLQRAKDAVYVDTTSMSVREVVATLLRNIKDS